MSKIAEYRKRYLETGKWALDIPITIRQDIASRFKSFEVRSSKDLRKREQRRNVDRVIAKELKRFGSKEVEEAVDEALAAPIGHYIDYDMLKAQLDAFCTPSPAHNLINLWWYERAKERVLRELLKLAPRSRLKPRFPTTPEELADLFTRLDTSAGYLGKVTGKSKKGDNVEECFQCVQRIVSDPTSAPYPPFCVEYRTQLTKLIGSDGSINRMATAKTRSIENPSMEVVAVERIFAQPLQEFFNRISWYAGGFNGEEIQSLVRNYTRSTNFHLTIDYSKFDCSIPKWLIRDAFSIVWQLFGYDRSHPLCRWIENGFIHGKIAMYDGTFRAKQCGVPSGSAFTSMIDSLCNRIIVESYLVKRDLLEMVPYTLIMGDDNILHSYCELDRIDVSAFIRQHYAIEVNPDKCSGGTKRQDPEFLSRTWTSAGATRNIREVVAKLVHPERWRDYRKKGMRPELIIYGLYWVYPRTMREEFNVRKLLAAYPELESTGSLKDCVLEGFPGSARYHEIYLVNDNRLSLSHHAFGPGRTKLVS